MAIRMMAQRFPRSRFVGVDLAGEAIATARAQAEAARLTNTRFVAEDAATFSALAAFDIITAFDAIHDQAAPRRVLRAITVSLTQGGEGLGACWGEEKARELLAEAAFTSVEVSRVEGDPLNAYYVCRL